MFLVLKQLTSTFIYGVQPFSDEYALYEKCNHLLMKEERELEYPGKKSQMMSSKNQRTDYTAANDTQTRTTALCTEVLIRKSAP